jgi:hypothetical protein
MPDRTLPVLLPLNLHECALLVVKFPAAPFNVIDAHVREVRAALDRAGWAGQVIVTTDPEIDLASFSEHLMAEAGFVHKRRLAAAEQQRDRLKRIVREMGGTFTEENTP